MRLTLLLCLCVALPLPVLSATIHVPADHPTIQAGINAASTGDSILVAPGTYFENVVIDRRVALVSEAGAEVTTIDGRNLDTVILVRKWVDHAVIDGFRVTHGRATTWAGGITVDIDFTTGGYATIRRNIVEHNHSDGMAGGIYSVRLSIIQDNIIQYNNDASASKGICAMEVGGIIERNIVRYNGASGNLQNVLVWFTDSFAWNTIVNNQGSRDEVVFDAGGTIHHNTFVRISSFTPTVALWGPPYDFHNNIIVHGVGGGLDCHLSGANTISCNDVWGGGKGFMGDCADLEGSDGNFSADPLFCDASNGDYRLFVDSPCAAAAGCGLIGALPVGCGVTDVADSPPAVNLRLRVIPNPVRGVARFELGSVAATTLSIFDSQGRLVEQLSGKDGHWEWTPGSAPAGIYFAVPEGNSAGVESVKFLCLR